jgi:hypothetical protein
MMGVSLRAWREARALRAAGELEQAIFARVGGDAFDRAVEARDAEYVAGLRAAVAAAVEYALGGIERGERGAGPVPAVATSRRVLITQARLAARVGVSLDTVLRRYVLGRALTPLGRAPPLGTPLGRVLITCGGRWVSVAPPGGF